MKFKQAFRIILFVVLLIGVSAYLVFAMTNLLDGDPHEVCTEVSLVVEENPHASFIDNKRVEELLKAAQLYPKGKLMQDIDTRQIEESLRSNNFIESVECYKTNNGMEVGKGKVCIRVSQRTPVAFVMPDGQAGYYVDADGMIIPNSTYAKNLVTATGNINQAYATKELSTFCEYIQHDSFWDNLIEQIYVTQGKDQRRFVTLVPRVGDHTIYMGTLDKFEQKLRRLRIFYEQGLPKVGWNKYSKLNLEFNNQVVCTKK